MDNDRTGIIEAIWLRDNYDIIPFLIPIDSGCKDFAEYYCKYKDSIYDDIYRIINNIEYYENLQHNRKSTKSINLPF